MIRYYNQRKKVSDRYDPLERKSEKDTNLTEETGSAGNTPAPGAPAPAGYVATGANEKLHVPKGGKTKKD